MRGQTSLFKEIFVTTPPSHDGMARKGRSAKLHADRNECLVARYFYKCHFTEIRYNIIIDQLSKEFFISPVTIPEVLSEYAPKLHALKKQNPDKRYFQQKWPHLVW